MLIATLNAVLVDGGYGDIVAIGLVANEEEGEFWFCNNKPIDGTQVDYVLHKIPVVFAAPKLLAACRDLFDDWLSLTNQDFNEGNKDVIALTTRLEEIITEAKRE